MTPSCNHQCPMFNTEMATSMAGDIGQIKGLVEGIKEEQAKMYRAVFVGNGKKCIDERLTELERTHAGDDRIKSNRRNNIMNIASLIASIGTLVMIAFHMHWI